jgi:hypothetical protein
VSRWTGRTAVIAGLLVVLLLTSCGSARSTAHVARAPSALLADFARLDRGLTQAGHDVARGKSVVSQIDQINRDKLDIIDGQFAQPVNGVKGTEWFRQLDCVDAELAVARAIEARNLGTSPHGAFTKWPITAYLNSATHCEQRLANELPSPALAGAEPLLAEFAHLHRGLTETVHEDARGKSVVGRIDQIKRDKLDIIDGQFMQSVNGVVGSQWFRQLDCVDQALAVARTVEAQHLGTSHRGAFTKSPITAYLNSALRCDRQLESELRHTALTAALFGPGLGGAATPVAASFYREDFTYGSGLPDSREANLYRLMVLQWNHASQLPALRAANPRLKAFVYQDVLETRASDEPGNGVCTGYAGDLARHPSWFLRDRHGHRIVDRSYPANYLMDVGNPAYRESCVAHAIAKAMSERFSGVYLDNVTPDVGFALPSGITVPAYPTPATWQAAMSSFVDYATAQIHAHHLLALGNIGGSANYPGLWEKWGALLDGAEEQSFTDSGSGVVHLLWAWPAQLAHAQWSQANGKYALLHSNSATEAGNTFGLATMLLVGDGDALYSTANANFDGYEKWYPEYTTAEGLGTPLGAYAKLTNGVYQRMFGNGLVLVNPTTKAVSLSLGGGTYSGSGFTNVKSASLPPATALILAKATPPSGA